MLLYASMNEFRSDFGLMIWTASSEVVDLFALKVMEANTKADTEKQATARSEQITSRDTSEVISRRLLEEICAV